MADDEHKDNEKVLYKTGCRLGLPRKEPEEADCLITEEHIMIKAGETISIPLCCLKKCDVHYSLSYDAYSIRDSDPLRGNVTLVVGDDMGNKQKLSLKMASSDLSSFKRLIDQLIVEEEEPGFWEKHFGDTVADSEIDRIRKLRPRGWEKKVNEVCKKLCLIGLDAQVSEQGRLQERIIGDPSDFRRVKCLGIIEINLEPIRWVNVVRQVTGGYQGDRYFHYRNLYLVPAPSVPILDLEHVTDPLVARSIRIKSLPLIGRVIGLRWEGRLQGNLIVRLNEDAVLSESIIRLGKDIEIRSFPAHRCWSINSGYSYSLPDTSREEWDCYKNIAHHLLESSKK